ncbi:pyridoxamine 5'-phosphate oxidase family protein [Pseudonocardia sp. RS010]|uniref:pyridoxamine 5'-phosphate oxidase family protein n=1 Tax=Pseudonocardia sp. RS010 TaxID=3385979 RepID=UPI00399F69D0
MRFVDFDVDEFLQAPLTARVATSGPTVRPTWFLWEDGAFWILTGPWSRLPGHVEADPRVALTIDVCDVSSGLVRQVIARGRGVLMPFDVARGRRKLVRYLGADEMRWDSRFRDYLAGEPGARGTVWLQVRPERMTAADLSYRVADEQEPDPEDRAG